MIYLVRHGQTEWNVAHRMQGRQESPLTLLGERQAAAMGKLLAGLVAADPPTTWRLVSSPLGRARQTAAFIAESLGVTVEIDERLAEIAFGEWEGRIREEVAPLHPELFATPEWLFSPPGGETYEDVRARVVSFLEDLPAEPNRRVIAVSHGVTGRVLRGVYADLSRHDTLMQAVPQDAVFRLLGGAIERIDCPPVS